MSRHPRTSTIVLSDWSSDIVLGILIGHRPHTDLRDAFDWEETPEGHRYWAEECHARTLSLEARRKLAAATGLSQRRLLQLMAA